MQSEGDVNRAIDQYADMVWRVCMCHLQNRADAEDVFQNVFLKYMLKGKAFEDEEHKKAWLLRVAINACKDCQRSFFRRNVVSMDALGDRIVELPEEHREVLEALRSLPAKYKDALYLHYYEGYTAAEIGEILGKKENTVYSLLSRGRELLKKELGGGTIGG